MSTTFNSQGIATEIDSTANPDGSYTYEATISGLKLTWNDGRADHECKVTAQFTVSTPSAMDVPGHGNVFRLGDGYNVHVTGTDFDQ
ncbi:hypothetical protein [Kitasatospora sp. GP82]|uniref:hypothetical protein n=1 Tax=Kitasatospora sp. GP82 TaxID=3035089 RepID=UPI0024759890|nr:hypothetical protein [Kitasatospora sp. GP82]MDH6123429.1 hypothetical protein [Kitasatospora sp. GP82]